MWRPSEPFSPRDADRRRREAYLEVMRRTAEVYAIAEQVAPELGMAAQELIEDGRRFWLRAWAHGARSPREIEQYIATGEGQILPPVDGDEEPFALPSFFSADPRMPVPALPMAVVRVTLDQVLGHPKPAPTERDDAGKMSDD